MPMKIEHIDAIARRLQRDVLYIAFNPQPTSEDEDEAIFLNGTDYQYDNRLSIGLTPEGSVGGFVVTMPM